MRRLLNFLLFILLALSLGGLISNLSLHLSHFSPLRLKTILSDTQIYSVIHQQLLDFAPSSDSPEIQKLLTLLLTDYLTPDYLQTKVNALIDDTSAWLRQETAVAPVLSFSDLKQQLIQENPKVYEEIHNFALEYEANRPALEAATRQAAIEAGEVVPPSLPNINLTQFFESEPIISIGSYLTPLRQLYWIQAHWYLFFLLFSIILTLIYLLNRSRQPLKTLGWGLMFALAYNALPLISIYLAAHQLPVLLTHPSLPSFLQPLLMALLTPFLSTYFPTALAALGICLILSLICFFLSRSKSSPSKA